MLLPRGAVEDLLQELRAQQAAAEAQRAQQAQQMQSSQLGFHHGAHLQDHIGQPMSHIVPGDDDVQQLNDFQAALHNGFDGTGSQSSYL